MEYFWILWHPQKLRRLCRLQQFLGRNIKELFPPVIADQTFFALERALATGQLHAFEYGIAAR